VSDAPSASLFIWNSTVFDFRRLGTFQCRAMLLYSQALLKAEAFNFEKRIDQLLLSCPAIAAGLTAIQAPPCQFPPGNWERRSKGT